MDVRLYHTVDGGEIDHVNGQAVLDAGLETAAYLSLFGGNQDDPGIQPDDPNQWWGNADETVEARKYRSRTQHLLRALPATAANLKRVQDAAEHDLGWLSQHTGGTVSARASIPKLDTIKIEVRLRVNDQVFPFDFVRPWAITA